MNSKRKNVALQSKIFLLSRQGFLRILRVRYDYSMINLPINKRRDSKRELFFSLIFVVVMSVKLLSCLVL
jgi:hypothetical protein